MANQGVVSKMTESNLPSRQFRWRNISKRARSATDKTSRFG
jgi:hypothetical protein